MYDALYIGSFFIIICTFHSSFKVSFLCQNEAQLSGGGGKLRGQGVVDCSPALWYKVSPHEFQPNLIFAPFLRLETG